MAPRLVKSIRRWHVSRSASPPLPRPPPPTEGQSPVGAITPGGSGCLRIWGEGHEHGEELQYGNGLQQNGHGLQQHSDDEQVLPEEYQIETPSNGTPQQQLRQPMPGCFDALFVDTATNPLGQNAFSRPDGRKEPTVLVTRASHPDDQDGADADASTRGVRVASVLTNWPAPGRTSTEMALDLARQRVMSAELSQRLEKEARRRRRRGARAKVVTLFARVAGAVGVGHISVRR